MKYALVLLVALLGAFSTAAARDAVPEPGTRYAVTYEQGEARWRATPESGRAQVWKANDARCATVPIPQGYWLVTRAPDGTTELVAPSHTELPEGFPERLPVRGCEAPGPYVVHAPTALIELLAADAGVVYVDE